MCKDAVEKIEKLAAQLECGDDNVIPLLIEIVGVLARFSENLEKHIEHHKQNEHKWGIQKLMSRHPFKTLLLGMGIMGLLTGQAPILIRTIISFLH